MPPLSSTSASTPYSARPSVLPLPTEGRGSYTYWKKEVDAALERLKEFKPEWDRNVMSYRAKPLTSTPEVDTVVVPRDFAMVEQKSAQLFFRTPEVHLKTRLTPLQDAITKWQPVLNHYLGEDEADSMSMMNEVLFDALCPAALMCSVIGYETFIQGTQQQETGEMVEDPDFEPDPDADAQGLGQSAPGMLPGAILGTGAPLPPPPAPPLIPGMQEVPNIVYARVFWNRFSPAAAIIPASWSGSKYDKAPFLGYRFRDTWLNVKKSHQLDPHMEIPKSKNTNASDLKIKSEVGMDTTSFVDDEEVTGWCIWYQTSLFDPTEVDPRLYRQLICLDGMKEPLVHRNSPYQEKVGPFVMGMLGNPVHIGSLRYVSDSAYPPSECSISRSSNEELNKSRTQMMLQRDRSLPMRLVNLARIGGQPGLDKLRQNRYQALIGVENFDQDKPPVTVVQLASFPRENFTFNDYLDSDLGQVWAMGANQRVQYSLNSIAATETAKIDQWATTRLDKERAKALTYYMQGVRKFGALLQKFLSDEQIAAVIGQEDMARLQPWNRKQTPNAFTYDCDPDAAIRRDPTETRQESLKLYELTAKDPHANSPELLTALLRAFNKDPAKLVQPNLPPKANPMAISVKIDPMQLDVRNPSFPIILALLKENGYSTLEAPVKDPQGGPEEPSPVEQALTLVKIQGAIMAGAETGNHPDIATLLGPQMTGQAQPGEQPGPRPEHGGAAPHAERLSKHHAEETGHLPGAGKA